MGALAVQAHLHAPDAKKADVCVGLTPRPALREAHRGAGDHGSGKWPVPGRQVSHTACSREKTLRKSS